MKGGDFVKSISLLLAVVIVLTIPITASLIWLLPRTIHIAIRIKHITAVNIHCLIFQFFISDYVLNYVSMCFNLLPENIPHQCNKKLVIDSLAYKLFYEVVIRIVLGTEPVDAFLGILKTLQNIEETL